jgi:hypothetical protein
MLARQEDCMLRHFTAIAIGALVFTPGCDKKDDASTSTAATAASAQAPAGSASGGDRHDREHEHDWDGGGRGDHPR